MKGQSNKMKNEFLSDSAILFFIIRLICGNADNIFPETYRNVRFGTDSCIE